MISVSIVLLPSLSKLHMRSSMVSARSAMSGHGVRSWVVGVRRFGHDLYDIPVDEKSIIIGSPSAFTAARMRCGSSSSRVRRIVSRSTDRFAFDGSFRGRRRRRFVKNRYAGPLPPPRPSGRVLAAPATRRPRGSCWRAGGGIGLQIIFSRSSRDQK